MTILTSNGIIAFGSFLISLNTNSEVSFSCKTGQTVTEFRLFDSNKITLLKYCLDLHACSVAY